MLFVRIIPAWLTLVVYITVCLISQGAVFAQQQFDLDLQANWYLTLSPFPDGYDPKQDKGLFSHNDNAGYGTPSVMTDLAVDAKGNSYAIMASLRGPRTNLTRQHVMIKHDPAGRQLWRQVIGDFKPLESVYDITIDPKANIYIAGNKILDGRRGSKLSHGFVICLSPEGRKRWSYMTNNTSPEVGAFYTAIATDGNSVFVTGYAKGRIVRSAREQSSHDILLTRLNLKGEHVWTKQFQGEQHERRDRNFSITVTPKGTVCLAGNYSFFPRPDDGKRPEGDTGIVVAVDQRGKKLWAKKIGVDNDRLNSNLPAHKRTSINTSISSDEQGNLYIVGVLNNRPILTKLSPKGDDLWTRWIDEIEGLERHQYSPNCVRIGPDGNVWITGPWESRPSMICYSSDGKVQSARVYAEDEIYTASDFDFLPGTNQAVIWGKCDPWLANKDPQNYGPQYFMANINLQSPKADD